MAEQQRKRLSAFTGIGPLIGAIIGGANFGITGAMAGGVLGAILISSGIEVQINDLRSKGKFNPFPGAVVVAYILAVILTFVAVKIVPAVNDFLTEEGKKPGLISIIVLYIGPAFAGGIGACIPVWLSAGRKS